jgi:two-component system response regulator
MITGNPEILLIEDSEYEAELTFKALAARMPAVRYSHLREGKEALQYLFNEGIYENQSYSLPLLIILDLDLPRMKGLEVLKAIKADPRTRSIPVIIVTVSTSEEEMKQAYLLGANSFVIKPLNFVKFSLVIADIANYWLLVNDLPNYAKPSQGGLF